jgi:hypothetical protein
MENTGPDREIGMETPLPPQVVQLLFLVPGRAWTLFAFQVVGHHPNHHQFPNLFESPLFECLSRHDNEQLECNEIEVKWLQLQLVVAGKTPNFRKANIQRQIQRPFWPLDLNEMFSGSE